MLENVTNKTYKNINRRTRERVQVYNMKHFMLCTHSIFHPVRDIIKGIVNAVLFAERP